MDDPAKHAPFMPEKPNALRVWLALLLRELITSYARMPGRYFWAFLQPIAMTLVLAVAFSLVLRTPPLGVNFLLFYATGFLPLRNFQEVSRSVSMGLNDNRSLLAYPRVAPLDVLIARFVLFAATQALVGSIIFAAILMTQNHYNFSNPLPLIYAYALLWLLSFGWGVFNAVVFLKFPIWKTIWTVITQPLILISGVLFLIEDLPSPASDILWFNPIAHMIAYARQSFYPSYQPDFVSLLYVLLFSLIPLVLGLLLLRRYGRSVIYF